MLRWRQLQLIQEKLAGNPHPVIRPADLDEPWRTIYTRLQPPPNIAQAKYALFEAADGLPDAHQLVQQILDTLPDPNAPGPRTTQFPSLAQLSPTLPPIDWLWPDWLPRGLLSLLGAAPGAGKSLVALDLARRVIHGPAFPDGAPVPTPGGNVVYVDAEAVPQIVNQRALAWNIDLARAPLPSPS